MPILHLMDPSHPAPHRRARRARTALAAGAHRLALTHFSQRYSDTRQHLSEAREIFPETVALRDLDRVAIPRRR